MTFEKWEKRDFIHHEIERLVDLRVTLLQGPLGHLGNQFLPVFPIKDGGVCDSLEAWSFAKSVYRDLIISVRFLLIVVCYWHVMCNFKNKKDVLATVGDASGEVNHRIQSSNVSILSIKYLHVIFEWTSGVDSSWKVLWSARVLIIDIVIVILMPLLTLQEISFLANIDNDHKSELFLKLDTVERTVCCHLDHPNDLFFYLTRTQVFIDVYSVKF